jgi:hypothetical protein
MASDPRGEKPFQINGRECFQHSSILSGSTIFHRKIKIILMDTTPDKRGRRILALAAACRKQKNPPVRAGFRNGAAV